MQIFADGKEIQIVNDHEISRGGGDDQLVRFRSQLHPHQPRHVEHSMEWRRLILGVGIDVPSVNGTVEATCY